MNPNGTRIAIRLARRYPRTAARIGWTMAKHPRRTARLLRLSREAPETVRAARDWGRLIAAAYSAPPARPKRRRGRVIFAAAAAVGAGGYATARAIRGRNGAAGPAPLDEHDETLAGSFPASDPPPGPAA